MEGEGARRDGGEAKGGEWEAATQAHARYTGRCARPTARRPLSPWHSSAGSLGCSIGLRWAFCRQLIRCAGQPIDGRLGGRARARCRLWCRLRIAARRECKACLRGASRADMRRKQGGQLASLADRDRFTHSDCATILSARSRRRNRRKRQHTRPVQTTSRAEVSSTGTHFSPPRISDRGRLFCPRALLSCKTENCAVLAGTACLMCESLASLLAG